MNTGRSNPEPSLESGKGNDGLRSSEKNKSAGEFEFQVQGGPWTLMLKHVMEEGEWKISSEMASEEPGGAGVLLFL